MTVLDCMVSIGSCYLELTMPTLFKIWQLVSVYSIGNWTGVVISLASGIWVVAWYG